MHARLVLIVIAWMATLTACGGDATTDSTSDTAREADNVVVRGVVLTNGKPVENAWVWLHLWPEEEAAEAEPGATIDTWSSKAVATDKQGRYVLRLDPASLDAKYLTGDYLNVDIQVWAAGRSSEWGSTVYRIGEGTWRSDEQASADDPVPTLSMDMGTSAVVLTDSLGGRETGELLVTDGPRAMVPTSDG